MSLSETLSRLYVRPAWWERKKPTPTPESVLAGIGRLTPGEKLIVDDIMAKSDKPRPKRIIDPVTLEEIANNVMQRREARRPKLTFQTDDPLPLPEDDPFGPPPIPAHWKNQQPPDWRKQPLPDWKLPTPTPTFPAIPYAGDYSLRSSRPAVFHFAENDREEHRRVPMNYIETRVMRFYVSLWNHEKRWLSTGETFVFEYWYTEADGTIHLTER